MRRIRLDQLQLPPGWKELAARARCLVEAAAPLNRVDVVNNNSDVWRALKPNLANLSNNKCWYCETPRVREDGEVDHFRPKSARDNDDHNGYWWLAFDESNFRFSCKYCNQHRMDPDSREIGGKGSTFPLLVGGTRACCPKDPLDEERCALLDPIRPGDAELLGFTEDGQAVPEADPDLEPDEVERAHISIRTYHLNHSWLRAKREQLALGVKSLIAQAQENFQLHLHRRRQGNYQATEDAKKRFQVIREQLMGMKEANADYSSLVTAILRANRVPERPWVDRLLG